MGCCHPNNSQPFPNMLEDHEKLRKIDLRKPEHPHKSILVVEHFAYYEKNPEKHGKYIIKKREIQKSVPILRSISESRILSKRSHDNTTKETESPQSSDNTTIEKIHSEVESMELAQ